jgi:hypothetical protein
MIFQGEKKILSMHSFGGEVKAVLSHVANLRYVNEPQKSSVNSLHSGQICRPFLAQYFHLSLLGSLASLWRAGQLVVQVETSRISGCAISL